MIDWLVTKILEWWAHPSIAAKIGLILTFAGAASLVGASLLKLCKAVRWCVRQYRDWHTRHPLEGLTAAEPPPTPHFTGREEEQKLLAALLQNHHVCAVAGAPLIGKSWLISKVIRSGGMEGRCIFVELKPKRGLSALLFAINAGLVRLECDHFDGVCLRDDLTPQQKAQELRPLLVEGNWVIVLDAYERVEDGGEIDRTMESWSKGLGDSRVVLGTRWNPSWLSHGAVLDVPAMPAEQMNALCRRLGLTEAEADEVCGHLAGLPGAAGVFRGVLEQKGPKAARKLVGRKPEKLGRTLFEAAFKAAPQAAQEVWMVASWFPQPLTRHAAFVICGEDVFKDGVSLLERWTVLTEGSERLDLHAWATRTGRRALRWQWRKRRAWAQQAARFYAAFAEAKAEDRTAIEAELENLLAAARLAFQYQEWEALWTMGHALGQRTHQLGHWTACEQLLRLCAAGAAKAGNKEVWATFTHNLCNVLQGRGKLKEAEDLYRRSLEIKREVGDRPGEANTLHQLGMVAQIRGNVEEAEELYGQARVAFVEIGDRRSEAAVLHQFGMVAEIRGKLEEAEDLYNQSLQIEREVGDRPGESRTLHQLGNVAYLRKKLEEAEDLYRQSLDIERETGNRPAEAITLHQLGIVAQRRGKLEEAEGLYTQSLEIKREVGDRPAEAITLHQLGIVAQRRGKLEEAEGLYRQSLEIKRQVGDRPGEARTLAQMGRLAEKQGNLRLAAERIARAHRMFEDMGLREAEQAKGDLDRLRKRSDEEG